MAENMKTTDRFIQGLCTGVVIMSSLNLFVNSCTRTDRESDARQRVFDVQEHNAQLHEELGEEYPGLGQLILNDETDTYEFHLTPEGEQPQVCEGEYRVTDGVAQLTGDIACTTTVAVGEN